MPTRTALFVPASRPERIGKALASGADCVIVDLEDAVARDDKDQARQNLADYLTENPDQTIFVRVNGAQDEAHQADIALCKQFDAIIGVVLPKAETAEDIDAMGLSHKRIWPLVESAKGVANCQALATAQGVERLAAGFLDLCLDFGFDYGKPGVEDMLDQVRFQIVLASRLANINAPIEGVFPDIDNRDGLYNLALKVKFCGFDGMLCIHPRQIEPIHKAFTPTQAEKDWAERVVTIAKTHNGGAFSLDGAMVDAPVIAKAQRILERYNEIS